MKYQLVLFNLGNEMLQLESIITENEIEPEFAEKCRTFYKAERYEIREVQE